MANAEKIVLPIEVKGAASSQAALGGITKAMTGLIGAYASWRGIAMVKNFFASSIAAWKTQQEAARGTTVEMQRYAESLQAITTLGDEQTLSIMRMGTMMGVSADKINETTKAAIGLSTALGVDYISSMRMVALAQAGEFRMLSRYLPQVRILTDAKEKMAAVLQLAAKGWRMETQAAADNRKTGMMNYFGDLLELIGQKLDPTLNDIYKGFTQLFASPQAKEFASTIGQIANDIVNAFTGGGGMSGLLDKLDQWRYGQDADLVERRRKAEASIERGTAELKQLEAQAKEGPIGEVITERIRVLRALIKNDKAFLASQKPKQDKLLEAYDNFKSALHSVSETLKLVAQAWDYMRQGVELYNKVNPLDPRNLGKKLKGAWEDIQGFNPFNIMGNPPAKSKPAPAVPDVEDKVIRYGDAVEGALSSLSDTYDALTKRVEMIEQEMGQA